jgi:hypothetical protein
MSKKLNVVVRLLLVVLAASHQLEALAQDTANNSGVSGFMRSNDKIYVVMAICLTILVGLVFYAIRIDRKIKRIEDGTSK